MAAKISLLCWIIVVVFSVGKINGTETETVEVYELKKGNFSVKLTNYGATVLSVILPDKNGKLDDITLGYESIEEYKNDSTYFGTILGRVANRIGGAQFTLDGILYKLPANDGKNMLHGGPRGFSDVIWTVKSYKNDSHITLTYDSFDGEQGFPGNVSVSVTYILIQTNKLALKFEAKALNKATPVNLASHVYWNLGGHTSGNILSHNLQLFGSKITQVDDKLIPTGAIIPIKGTPYDFLEPRQIGSRINELPDGYDINYVLDDSVVTSGGKHLKKAAVVHESVSGRKMELWTNAPGMQFFTSNTLNTTGKGGFVYSNHAALCLETQGFPDSVNHPNFPSQIVKPGEFYKHIMLFRFTAQ